MARPAGSVLRDKWADVPHETHFCQSFFQDDSVGEFSDILKSPLNSELMKKDTQESDRVEFVLCWKNWMDWGLCCVELSL